METVKLVDDRVYHDYFESENVKSVDPDWIQWGDDFQHQVDDMCSYLEDCSRVCQS